MSDFNVLSVASYPSFICTGLHLGLPLVGMRIFVMAHSRRGESRRLPPGSLAAKRQSFGDPGLNCSVGGNI
ncbi:hypothetical protein ASPBRDRAFT_37924 [Aspergillus brasiliensis CBS 101740]|uniref:Uncharacterized protein n=1 Tax=Aspergillus brasiliensis (strain CBS 101740 / IMI 381727 / IBT 21946) TaxID=767769 RepID=A0A1L9UVB6_ASPBC|nr:hypothetical protein ASPBRDRAFT_37924 [Aspergillus brasiliensis CBS 101740]